MSLASVPRGAAAAVRGGLAPPALAGCAVAGFSAASAPSNSSGSVLDPLSVSKRYSFSISTQGRLRRSAVSWSPRRVSSCSFASSRLRAAARERQR